MSLLNEDTLAIKQIQERFHLLQQLIDEIELKRAESDQGINALKKFANAQEDPNNLQNIVKTIII